MEEIFNDMPWYAWLICAVYAVLWAAFILILVQLFRKKRKTRGNETIQR